MPALEGDSRPASRQGYVVPGADASPERHILRVGFLCCALLATTPVWTRRARADGVSRGPSNRERRPWAQEPGWMMAASHRACIVPVRAAPTRVPSYTLRAIFGAWPTRCSSMRGAGPRRDAKGTRPRTPYGSDGRPHIPQTGENRPQIHSDLQVCVGRASGVLAHSPGPFALSMILK